MKPTDAPDLAARERDAIRDYYEQNTPLFLRFARTETQTIHRAVWGDGVRTLTDALAFTNELLAQEIHRLTEERRLARIRIADLGCGVGGSVFHLLTRLAIPAQVIGVTLSRTQAEIARATSRKLGHERACVFVEGDFLAPPIARGLGAAYSIEAFCHAVSVEEYVAQVSRMLAPGGLLILCDDFLSMWAFLEPNPRGQVWLRAYQNGWRVPNLRTVLNLKAFASEHDLNFISDRDLTPLLKLRALPDRLATMLRALGERLPAWHPIVPSMVGMLALQQCLKMRQIEYHFLVFEKG